MLANSYNNHDHDDLNLFCDRGALLPRHIEAFLPLDLASNISALLPSDLRYSCDHHNYDDHYHNYDDHDHDGDDHYHDYDDHDHDGDDNYLITLLPGHLPGNVVALLTFLLATHLPSQILVTIVMIIMVRSG